MTPTIDELIHKNNLSGVAPAEKRKFTLQTFQQKRVSHKTNFPKPEAVVMVAERKFAKKGQLSVLIGPPKSGKTILLGCMLSTAFDTRPVLAETLNVVTTPANGRAVVYLDFEQHISDTQDLHDKVLRNLNTTVCPENLYILNFQAETIEERQHIVKAVFTEFNNPHLLVLDGLADLVTSVNEEKECNALIEELLQLGAKHDTAIVGVIHENKGGGTVRGHLGAQAERKASGMISVRKDRAKNIHVVECKLVRGDGDFEPYFFQWNDTDKRMLLVDETTTAYLNSENQKSKEEKDTELLQRLFKNMFLGVESLERTEFYNRFKLYYDPAEPCSDKTVERYIKRAVELELLTVEGKRDKKVYTQAK